ncbi:MAG: selenocysteine-specific translation elongation factor, partial [Chloroflexota bacterium]
MFVIGTAGHVDHGKSTLVEALTGIDPDRLNEEKEREMTIDLGFAWLQLGDEEVGVVDVPGHRDFIENMLAGVGGIDLALFVVAADEGAMPQTREHLAILDLLEVNSGIVALTKVDLIDDPDWLELVMLDLEETFAGTVLENAPIMPVSAKTGDGLAELRILLTEKLSTAVPRPDNGRPRLPVDRVFTVAGFGTIVTGTLLDGRFRLGDSVELQPTEKNGRIRGLQTHRTKLDVARPGSRVAINVTGLSKDEVQRGNVVTLPKMVRGTVLFDASYRHLAAADAPLKHNMEVKLFVGAAEVVARTRVLGAKQIDPGEEGWLQLALSESAAIVRGDRFILRRPSPGATLGGGKVLDPYPGRRHRRFRPDVIAR